MTGGANAAAGNGAAVGNAELRAILDEVGAYGARISGRELKAAAEAIVRARRVFVAGAGRTGFASRAFANRMMHLGKPAFFVGETTTPSVGEGDVLVVGSGSGTTASLVAAVEKAKGIGVEVVTLTMFPDHRIGALADVVVAVPGVTPKRAPGEAQSAESIQPMGSLFEQLCWLAYDALVLILMPLLGQTGGSMFERHANLE